MELRNSKPIKIKNNSTDLELQVLDWQWYDILPESGTRRFRRRRRSSQSRDSNFGVDTNNQSLSVKVTGFKPDLP